MRERCADDAEADARVLMAKHAAISPRGWDTILQRRHLHQRIDKYLDEWHLLSSITEFEAL